MKGLAGVCFVPAVFGLSALLLAPAAMAAPGKGWDTFNLGQGDPIPVSGKHDTRASAGSGSTGKGWDTFNTGQGDPIPASGRNGPGAPPATGDTGETWQVFYTGERNRL